MLCIGNYFVGIVKNGLVTNFLILQDFVSLVVMIEFTINDIQFGVIKFE